MTEANTRNRLASVKPANKGLFDEVGLRGARELVGSLRPDDGVDPRELAKQRRKERKQEQPGGGHGAHKQEQFLTQVQQAIEGALQSAATPVLNSLMVREVTPQGGSLVVVLQPQVPFEASDFTEATEALARASSMLRREVAAAITRKDVPNLSFMVLPPGAEKLPE